MSPRGPASGSASPPSPVLARTLRMRLRRLLGLRQTVIVDTVRYRERTPEPMRHALSRKGPGHKDYDVHFRDGSLLRIRATATRQFADLTGARLLPVYERVSRLLTPGLRVAILGGGTGYAAAWVASRVGPSGAVVSLDRDEESIAFARRRYPSSNIAFEVGGVEALSGETDSAFDSVIAVDAFGAATTQESIAELWRVVGAPGWMYVAEPVDPSGVDPGASVADAFRGAVNQANVDAARPPGTIQPAPDVRDGWAFLMARREGED